MRTLLKEVSAAKRRRRIRQGAGKKALEAVLQKQAVFLHIPKCGGKSMVTGMYGLQEHEWFGHPDFRYYEAILGPRMFAAFYKFAIVRDPFDRCRSAFYFLKAGGFQDKSFARFKDTVASNTFEEFVTKGILRNRMSESVLFTEQCKFFCDDAGARRIDDVFKFEDYRACTDTLVRKGFLNSETDHINRTEYPPSESLDPRVREEIRDIYARDYELLGYSRSPATWSE